MNNFKSYTVRSLKDHKGSPRVYLDIVSMAAAGFVPGKTYVRDVSNGKAKIVLTVQDNGTHVVSRKDEAGKVLPIIDINSRDAFRAFDGMKAVRIIVQANRITILPLASETKRLARLDRLRTNIAQGFVTTGSIASGGCVMDHAAHAGLARAGLKARLAMVNEFDDALLTHAANANDVVSAETLLLSGPMQEVVQDNWAMERVGTFDILAMGLPCSGASIAGKSKRKLDIMESHPEVGGLIAPAIMFVNQTQPAAVVLENVHQYASSASAQILRSWLRDSGYDVQEVTLCAQDFGSLENRKRWFMVGCTRGIDLDLSGLAPTLRQVRTLSEVLEPIGPDAADWRAFEYLKIKQERDAEKGSSFAMQIVTPSSTSVPVIRKSYAKGGSTDPLLAHPTDPDLLRQLTVVEHSRCKGVPEHIVPTNSKAAGHAMLGQGIDYPTVSALFARIGQALLNWAKTTTGSASIQEIGYSLRLATG